MISLRPTARAISPFPFPRTAGRTAYPYPVTSVTGDSTNVTTGAGKHIVWNIRADYPEEDLPNARVLVMADDGIVQYTLTYLVGANGSILGPTPQTVTHGGSGTPVTAVPNSGYYFYQWSDGVLEEERTDTNVTADLTVTAIFGLVPVVISFAINNGEATTTDPLVTLNNTCVGSPMQYMASESPTFSDAFWELYDTGPSFKLSAGTGGTKTVYFKVKNASGESAVVSDTIDLVERTILLPRDVPLVLGWIPSGSYLMGRYPGEAPEAEYGLGNTYPAYHIS